MLRVLTNDLHLVKKIAMIFPTISFLIGSRRDITKHDIHEDLRHGSNTNITLEIAARDCHFLVTHYSIKSADNTYRVVLLGERR